MLEIARPICAEPARTRYRYSIATLVTDRGQYDAMLASFRAAGFTPDDSEYLYLDNSGGNRLSAFRGLNRLLAEAQGEHVILCHQDVRLIADRREQLDAALAALGARDPRWALAGNAGGIGPGRLAMRISDPHMRNARVGTLPERVASLDENFIVCRRDARLACSDDLDGFHLYGADLCLLADMRGFTAYVIDFHLEHLSGGTTDHEFWARASAFRAKYTRALRPRWLQTTCALMFLSGHVIPHALGGVMSRAVLKAARRMPGSRGFTPARPGDAA